MKEKEKYSPTKYFSEMAHYETERMIKIAESETRLEFYKNFKTSREGRHTILSLKNEIVQDCLLKIWDFIRNSW